VSELERTVGSRMRRLRRTDAIRELVRETRLTPKNLIAPIFVREGTGIVEPIAEMPGVSRYSLDRVTEQVERLEMVGVEAVLLFGIPDKKDELGSQAYSPEGVVPRAVKELRDTFPDLVIAADVCLCEYTSHGHCGVVAGSSVDNDRTLPLLARAAVEYANAGADIVAPSAMMDGQVGAIRSALDDAGLSQAAIMGYSAKYASCFYAPFREAAGSAPAFGDRKGYQMDPPNAREALREIAADVKEGADIVMVKPALAYLDVIAKARERFDVPLGAYNVSGEFAMVKAAARAGWLDERKAVMEQLIAMKRAGADVIITYFAEEAAAWLGEGK
jgi:porphobilinogen synthase